MPRQRKLRHSSAARRRRGNIIGVVIAVCCFCFLAALAGYVIWWGPKRLALDEFYCPKDVPPTAVYAVLVDHSDAFTTIQQLAVRNRLDGLRAEVPKFGRLEIYRVVAEAEAVQDRDQIAPVFSLCNPGTGAELDELTGNPNLARKRWESGFDQPLQEVFQSLMTGGGAETSPIMESIQALALQAFARDGLEATPKSLVIVSDMLHHTDKFSHYRSAPDFGQLKGTPYYRQLRSDLSGVKVTLLYLHRPEASGRQTPAHLRFWQAFFADQGAILAHFIPIEG
jgi:hypothetical protein